MYMYMKICQHHLYFDGRIYMYPFHGSSFFFLSGLTLLSDNMIL